MLAMTVEKREAARQVKLRELAADRAELIKIAADALREQRLSAMDDGVNIEVGKAPCLVCQVPRSKETWCTGGAFCRHCSYAVRVVCTRDGVPRSPESMCDRARFTRVWEASVARRAKLARQAEAKAIVSASRKRKRAEAEVEAADDNEENPWANLPTEVESWLAAQQLLRFKGILQ
mmetsp:Transcript_102618/g.257198  ORF Transcript_102618/g.257198 Transcript_102618/m.257198 type:complete len:177 (-) Transcript_102618:184-714(-)